jgi:hypothetical protein
MKVDEVVNPWLLLLWGAGLMAFLVLARAINHGAVE